jgi:hypothetical protein
MNMKDMIQRMTDLENEAKQTLTESEQLAECPPEMAEGPGMAPAPMNQGNPVTMSVNLNASGAEHVQDLINMMKNAGMGDAKPAADAMMPMRQDMERLAAMMDEPKEEEMDIDEGSMKDQMMDDAENMDKEDFCEKYMAMGMDRAECEEHWNSMNEEGVEEWANSPEGSEDDPEYSDHELMTKDLSGGINREKKAYAAAQRGDNAMAVEEIKAKLMAALAEKQKDQDDDGDNDFDDVKIARMKASGMDHDAAVAKVKGKK